MKHANYSKFPTSKPPLAHDPTKPIKCSLDIFEANKDAPIAIHPTLRPAKK